MEKPSIIYLFVSPSGRAYAGRHTCDPEGWPRRGTGPLPSGYRGSGKLWANVTRRHGPAIRWVILRRFPAGTPRATVDEAERRAIRLVRHLWGERCANVHEGGTGLTIADARKIAACPDARERRAATMSQPEVRSKYSAASKAAWADPAKRERLLAPFNDPEVRAKNSAAVKAAWADPEKRARFLSTGNTPELRAKRSAASKAWAATPEGAAAQARGRATARINNGWRHLAERHPEWWV